MSFHFESTSDYFKSVLSVVTLIKFAREGGEGNNEENRILFLKLCIVSMVTKFQVFIQNVLEEFLFNFRDSKITNIDVSLCMRLNSLRLIALDYDLTKKLTDVTQYDIDKFEEVRKHLYVMYDLCDDQKEINREFLFDCDFPIGKTGVNELIRLFKQLEGKNIFESPGIDLEKLNSILNLRHNIVHQDANPQLTETTVEKYKVYLDSIVTFIDEHLYNFIEYGKFHP